MKKILLLISLFFFIQISKAQEQFNIGINGGLTVAGTINDVSDFAFGLDANYLFQLTEDFVVGPSLGLIYYNTKEFEGVTLDPIMYLPIAAAIRFNSIDDVFYVGIDAGYAIGLSPDDTASGVFLKPIVGYKVSDSFKINLFYSGIRTSERADGYVGFGLTYDIKGRENSTYEY